MPQKIWSKINFLFMHVAQGKMQKGEWTEVQLPLAGV